MLKAREAAVGPSNSGATGTRHSNKQQQSSTGVGIHPAWIALIRHCQEIGFGEIERLKIQDGVPVLAERSIQRFKLT